jgi:DNA-directed RNA polymerase alpha subunit
LIDKGIISKWHYEDKKGNKIKDYIEKENDNPESDAYSIEINKKYSEWKNRNVIIQMPDEYLEQIPSFNKKKYKKTTKKVNNIFLY